MKFTTNISAQTNEDTWLCCPSCNESGGMHQEIITVYPSAGGVVQINTGNGNIRTWGSGTPQADLNPSMYRDGLTLHFSCEHCDGLEDGHSILNIYQHKGITFLNWGEKEGET